MLKKPKSAATPKRGRPVTIAAVSTLVLKLPAEMRAAIESRARAEHVTLSEAVRQLLDYALRRKPKGKPQP